MEPLVADMVQEDPGALAWAKSLPVFLRSRASSVRGSYAPGSLVDTRFGWLRRGSLLAIGTGPWAMSSQTNGQFPSQSDGCQCFVLSMLSSCSTLLNMRVLSLPAVYPCYLVVLICSSHPLFISVTIEGWNNNAHIVLESIALQPRNLSFRNEWALETPQQQAGSQPASRAR